MQQLQLELALCRAEESQDIFDDALPPSLDRIVQKLIEPYVKQPKKEKNLISDTERQITLDLEKSYNRPFPVRAKDFLTIQQETLSYQLSVRQKAIEMTFAPEPGQNYLTKEEEQALRDYYASGQHFGNGDQPECMQAAAEEVEWEYSTTNEKEVV